MKFYKVWLFNVVNGKESNSILVEDFETLNAAKVNGRRYRVGGPESYFVVREYDTSKNNIIGGDFSTDTGTTVYSSKGN